ncbi:MAG TPA: hypothetical protein VKV20_12605 [Ktedonobacteraceae bacterium]|jgi:hypothetical protein|nr:hypothetical protein [Ktedonobacteraceae bacterium]
MSRFLRVASLILLAAAIVIGVFLVRGKIPVASASCGSWSTQTSPSVNGSNSLLAVTAVAASAAWAVGDNNNSTLIEQWNGTNWQVVPSPNSPASELDVLDGVAAAAANDIWAVGYENTGGLDSTLIEHWDGTSWSIIASPNVAGTSNRLNAVSVISSTDVWAVGYSGANASQTLIENWNGTSWSIVPSPNVGTELNYLNGIAGDAAGDIYAVGAYENLGVDTTTFESLILHYDGTSWSVVQSPNQGNESSWLQSITLIGGTTQFLAVGYYGNGGYANTLIEQWDGSDWKIVSSPNGGSYNSMLYSVSAPDASNAWAIGSYNGSMVTNQTLIEYFNGTTWSVVPSPNVGSYENDLYAVAAYNDNTVWAVGDNLTTQVGSPQALIEFYC